MSGLYLFAVIGATRVAISTGEIEAVVKLGSLAPVPGSPRHVAGLATLRSRVLTIIDAAMLITGRGCCSQNCSGKSGCHAIVCDISGHSYGILVDGLEDIEQVDTPCHPVCGRLDPAWHPYVRGTLEHDGHPYMVLSIAGFIESPAAIAPAAPGRCGPAGAGCCPA